MPLNKLENFIKNVEGRILYVNPNDLDATDNITNQGNSLAQPFKTVQRAILESARFSYLKGNNNDIKNVIQPISSGESSDPSPVAPVATNVAVWPTQMELKPLTLITGRGVTVNVIGVDVTLHAAVFVFITV